ncbi:hypothetical protein NMC42_25795 [Pseudomonas aeruginosa]
MAKNQRAPREYLSNAPKPTPRTATISASATIAPAGQCRPSASAAASATTAPRVQYQARGRTSSATPPRAPSRNAIARVCRTAPGSSGSRGGGGNASPSISRTRRCAAASRPPA